MTEDEVAEQNGGRGGPPGPGGDEDAARPGRRRWLVLGAIFGLLVAAAVVALLVVRGDGDGTDDEREVARDTERPTPPPTVGTEIDTEGQKLLDLLEAGHELTYHAVYVVTGDPDVVGTEMRLEVWRRDGRVRQDMRQVTDAAVIETASFLLADDEAFSCQRIDEGAWSCARQALGDELTAAGAFGNIARELEGADVMATDEEVAGRQARCFSLEGAAGEVSQCVSEEGIPLRLRGNGAELLLEELRETVPEDIFDLPADPASGSE